MEQALAFFTGVTGTLIIFGIVKLISQQKRLRYLEDRVESLEDGLDSCETTRDSEIENLESDIANLYDKVEDWDPDYEEYLKAEPNEPDFKDEIAAVRDEMEEQRDQMTDYVDDQLEGMQSQIDDIKDDHSIAGLFCESIDTQLAKIKKKLKK